MKIEEIENSELCFDVENYEQLKTGLVIFPENLKDVEQLKLIKFQLKRILK